MVGLVYALMTHCFLYLTQEAKKTAAQSKLQAKKLRTEEVFSAGEDILKEGASIVHEVTRVCVCVTV